MNEAKDQSISREMRMWMYMCMDGPGHLVSKMISKILGCAYLWMTILDDEQMGNKMGADLK